MNAILNGMKTVLEIAPKKRLQPSRGRDTANKITAEAWERVGADISRAISDTAEGYVLSVSVSDTKGMAGRPPIKLRSRGSWMKVTRDGKGRFVVRFDEK
jgi:hypothetical protein